MESYSNPMTRILLLIAGLGCAATLASCGDGSSEGGGEQAGMAAQAGMAEQPAAEQPAAGEDRGAGSAARPRGPLVKLRGSQLGPVLFSGSDRALYTFTRDGGGPRSRCHGDCAEAWPPFFAKARPRAARGVKPSLLSTIRRGRRRQVTYRGQPLYFYEHDPRGEVLCNDIVEFGGTWFAVTAAGRAPA
jgi:predicted lipoprotein with Yx(FWY)xxD motif